MRDYFRQVLDAAGYVDDDPTEENVRSCFADYVAAGYWVDAAGLPLDLDDIEDITLDEICLNLLKGARSHAI